MPVEVSIENGKAKIKTPAGDTVEMSEAEFYQKHPDMAGRFTASHRLDGMDILATFREQLNPVKVGPIEIGDRVMVKASKEFGEIIREIGDSFRVQMGNDSRVQTHWAIELERR